MIANPDPFWRLVPPPTELEQGDIFADVPFLLPDLPVQQVEKVMLSGGRQAWGPAKKDKQQGNLMLSKGRFGYGMVVTHACTIEKVNNQRITLAWVEKAEKLADQYQDELRRQELVSYVFLPSVPGIGDCYADMRLIVTLPREILATPRLAMMTNEARVVLESKLIHFFTRINENWLQEQFTAADREKT